jgi:hypothetical protein
MQLKSRSWGRVWGVLLAVRLAAGCASTDVGPEESLDGGTDATGTSDASDASLHDAGLDAPRTDASDGSRGDADAAPPDGPVADSAPGKDASHDAADADAAPVVPTCVPDAGCSPADAGCTVGGNVVCTDAGAVCVPTGQIASPGTSCGSNAVCDGDGGCNACTAGVPCAHDGCTAWQTSCATGASACVDTGQPVAESTPCSGGVCHAGACDPVTCDAGVACNAGCYAGTTACPDGPTGTPTCSPSSTALAGGTTCSAGVCNGTGACVACTNGAACSPATCQTGQWNCSTYTCTPNANPTAPPGTACGTNKACDTDGGCDCTTGGTCTVPNSCYTGTYSCASGTSTCVTTSTPVTDGTTCGTNEYCYGGTCTGCANGSSCIPDANACQLGTLTCTKGPTACVPNGTYRPNGSVCGTNMVCNGGQCVPCAAGGTCTSTSVDPCALGAYACNTGSQQCVSGGPDPNKAGAACGASAVGVCSGGRCTCPAGQAFYAGDCQSCPVFSGTTVYVDSDPNVGVDNVCCGRFQASGQMFGGPCATITQGIANASSGWALSVHGDSTGNISPSEQYPIRIGRKLNVQNSGTVCIPGISNQHIVEFTDNTGPQLYGFTLGTSCQGVVSGASVGAYFGTGNSGTLNNVTIQDVATGVQVQGGAATLAYTTIQQGQLGIRIDTGSAALYATVTIEDMSDTGVLCRSDVNPSASSVFTGATGSGTLYALRCANYDVFASRGCSVAASPGSAYLRLGEQLAPSCPNPKRDNYGIYAEGNASVTPYFIQTECQNQDGVSLHSNASLSTNAPIVTVPNGSLIESSGCYGIYAEVGTLSALGTTITHNHWGVVQRSLAGSTDPTKALIDLNGASGTSTYPNTITCSGSREPGACCTSSNCPPGYGIWNNSGLPLQADNDKFDSSPPTLCSCDSNLANCVCSGFQGTPPTQPVDGMAIVNSPAPSGAGPGSTTKTNFGFVQCQ